MYADDTNISLAASNPINIENEMNNELKNLNRWLLANKLSLNVAKTEFMLIGSRQRLQTCDDYQINLQIDGNIIKKVEKTKSLGVFIDENLTWKPHIDHISKKISSGIGALKRLRPFVSTDTAIKIYDSLIRPHFDYCSPVWDGICSTLSDKLQRLQNRAARVILKCSYDTSSALLLDKLGWDNLSFLRRRQKAVLMFKTINDLTPAYLKELFLEYDTSYCLRNTNKKLKLPQPRTEYLKRSFGYDGAALWNKLPEHLRMAKSLGTFKKKLKGTS